MGGESATTATLTERLRAELPVGAKVVVCGSTLEGEERMLLEAWPAVVASEPAAVMVLAPRHPDRFAAVAAIIAASGLKYVRASTFAVRLSRIEEGSIFLLETIGDLAAMYSLGAVAFVGGSLVSKGGHNPLEPAQFGVPVVMGPSYENFREVVETMRASDAIRVIAPEAVASTIGEMLRNEGTSHLLGARGRAVFAAEAGATGRTIEALMKLLK